MSRDHVRSPFFPSWVEDFHLQAAVHAQHTKKNRAYNSPVFLAKLVEAAGVEPASANSPWKLLHA